MGARRTSCPRLTVREDAEERGFLTRAFEPDVGEVVELTLVGEAVLARHDRSVRIPVLPVPA